MRELNAATHRTQGIGLLCESLQADRELSREGDSQRYREHVNTPRGHTDLTGGEVGTQLKGPVRLGDNLVHYQRERGPELSVVSCAGSNQH